MAIGPVAGTATVTVDGKRIIQLRGSLTIQAMTLEKTGVVGQDGVHGYVEKPIIPFIEMECSNYPGFSLVALQAIKNSTVTAVLDGLQTYSLRGAWYDGNDTLDASEGKIKLKFCGIAIQEIVQ